MDFNDDQEPLLKDIESIVEQVKSGQKEPFRLLVKQYQRRIHVYCYHMLGNRQEAEDAVQDIFIKCFLHINRYTTSVSFSAWLYKLAYNHCINLLKKRSAGYRLLTLYRSQQLDTNWQFDHSVLIGELLSKLSSDDRNVLLLRVMEERGFEEIGQIIGCKPATVRKKYERIQKKLKKYWTQMEGYTNEQPRPSSWSE